MNINKHQIRQSSESPSSSPIVYFDATIRRKEKMKLASQRAAVSPKEVCEPEIQRDRENALSTTILHMPALAATTAEVKTPLPSGPSPSLPPTVEVPAANPLPLAIAGDVPTVNATSLMVVEPKQLQIRHLDRLETKQLAAFAVNFIVEHTGYPPDLVELDADLEADLGIDSITLAQLLGEVRDYVGVTPTGDLTLDSFKTLNDVIRVFQESAARQHGLLGLETEA
jgi:acyl carrier protein